MTKKRISAICLECQRGFTLVETMLTVFIVVVTLLGLLYSNEVLGRVNAETHERAVAVQDAHQVMEQMREAAQWGFFPQNVQNTFPNNGQVAGFNNLTNEQITITYTQIGELLDVSVSVAWLDASSRAAQYTLNSLLTQRE